MSSHTFALMINKRFIRPLKIVRQMAMDMIWIVNHFALRLGDSYPPRSGWIEKHIHLIRHIHRTCLRVYVCTYIAIPFRLGDWTPFMCGVQPLTGKQIYCGFLTVDTKAGEVELCGVGTWMWCGLIAWTTYAERKGGIRHGRSTRALCYSEIPAPPDMLNLVTMT